MDKRTGKLEISPPTPDELYRTRNRRVSIVLSLVFAVGILWSEGVNDGSIFWTLMVLWGGLLYLPLIKYSLLQAISSSLLRRYFALHLTWWTLIFILFLGYTAHYDDALFELYSLERLVVPLLRMLLVSAGLSIVTSCVWKWLRGTFLKMKQGVHLKRGFLIVVSFVTIPFLMVMNILPNVVKNFVLKTSPFLGYKGIVKGQIKVYRHLQKQYGTQGDEQELLNYLLLQRWMLSRGEPGVDDHYSGVISRPDKTLAEVIGAIVEWEYLDSHESRTKITGNIVPEVYVEQYRTQMKEYIKRECTKFQMNLSI